MKKAGLTFSKDSSKLWIAYKLPTLINSTNEIFLSRSLLVVVPFALWRAGFIFYVNKTLTKK